MIIINFNIHLIVKYYSMNKNYFILIYLLSLCVYSSESKNKTLILNVTNNLNISDVKKTIKKYERQYLDLYANSTKNKNLFCDRIDLNIKSFKEIKKKLEHIENKIDDGLLNDMSMKDFLNMRGDISFSIQNLVLIINKLQKRKKYCIKNEEEFNIIKNNIISQKNKNKERLINNINNILRIDNEL